MTRDFIELLCRAIGEQRDQMATPIINGAMQDYAQYRYAVGRVQGLSDAMAIIRRTFKTYEGQS